MKKFYLNFLALLTLTLFAGIQKGNAQAGTASATSDTICAADFTTLLLSGYSGTIQWQKFDGVLWNDETAPGFDSDMYTVMPGVSSQYRAIVTNTMGTMTDTSNAVSIFVQIIAVPTGVNASRCGLGPITVSASGAGLTTWYADSMSVTPIAQGNSYTTNIIETTTFYASTIDTTSSSSEGSTLLITEIDIGGPDMLEIVNVSANPIDVTGWRVAISNSYPTINSVNANVQTLTGVMQPGDLMYWTDGTVNPWGSNMLWNPGAYPTYTGWACIIDDTGEIVDIVFLNWLASDIATFNVNIGGFTVTVTDEWTGNGIDNTSTGVLDLVRQGNSDNDDLSDFIQVVGTNGVIDPGLTLPFPGGFCESDRVPVTASVIAPPPVTISAYPSNLICGTDTVSLVPSSSNAGYTYTWFSPMHVDTIIGDSLVAIVPSGTTYTVFSNDGTCASLDSVTIDVGAPTAAGVASVQTDSICSGYTIPLNLSGSAGVINWQFNNGGGWVTPGDSASMTSQYFVTPSVNTDYRAVLTSGGCPSDTTNILSLVTSIVSSPTAVATTICAGDTSIVTAGGSATVNWYADATTNYVSAIDSMISINALADTVVYVASSSGTTFDIGKASDFPGGLAQSIEPGKGLGFDVAESVTINRVYVYPFSSGDVEIVLRASMGGPIIASTVSSVTSGGSEVAIDLDWIVYPGTGYRMEMGSATTASLIRNTSGISYPINSPSGSMTITGFLNPGLSTGATYYYFFNWQVSDGCASPRVPVSITVHPLPAIPVISAAGNVLTSTSATTYQWYQDSVLIAGATMQSYTAASNGNYVVVITDSNGCSNSSASVLVNVGIEEFNAGIVNVYPNPVQDILQIAYNFNIHAKVSIRVFNTLGKLVINEEVQTMKGNGNYQLKVDGLNSGIYLVVLSVDDQLKSFRVYKE